MQKYINQLIEDLRAAKKYAPVQKDRLLMSDTEITEELEEIDRIIDEEPDKPLHNIFGIDPIVFPPLEKLTDKQAQQLAEEILALWGAFNIEAVYPGNFPKNKLYPLLIRKFKEPFMYFPAGQTGIEFCHYVPEECPFGNEFCMCKDINL